MIDREKVINELEWIIDLFSNYERHAMGDEEMQSLNDAISLLKEQESVDTIKREQEDRERPPLPPVRHEDLCLIFLCPECGCDLRYYRCERCYRCGRRVKWE